MARSSDPLTRGDALITEAAMASLRRDGERARFVDTFAPAAEGFGSELL